VVGKIIKGIGGFYYVETAKDIIYECKARGVFRNKGQKPLAGDEVKIDIIDDEKRTGYIVSILPRRTEIKRPAAANADQAIIIFAVSKPKINMGLLDRMLISMEQSGIDIIICVNKLDLDTDGEADRIVDIYGNAGYEVICVSALTGDGMERLTERLKSKTSILTGPSGVGKSSVINMLLGTTEQKSGELSEKLGRGRHTTRETTVLRLDDDTFIMDTPGFSDLINTDIDEKNLYLYFKEMAEYEGKCRFRGCTHINEPECSVKDALNAGKISDERYESYKQLYEELKQRRKK